MIAKDMPTISIPGIKNATFYIEEKSWIKHFYISFFLPFYAALFAMNVILGSENSLAVFISSILVVASQLLSVLLCVWFPRFQLFCTSSQTLNVFVADIVFIEPEVNNGNPEIVPLVKENTKISFCYRFSKYLYAQGSGEFTQIIYKNNLTLGEYMSHRGVSDEKEHTKSLSLYGRNEINIPVPSFISMMKKRAVAPFFVFQLFCVMLWSLDDYFYHSLLTFVLLVVFESVVVMQQRANFQTIQKMALSFSPISVYRNGKWVTVDSREIVPGDLISISKSQTDEKICVPCDLLILSGSCIVDESMLTGESVPQSKESIESSYTDGDESKVFEFEQHSKLSILHGGTSVLAVCGSKSSLHQTKSGIKVLSSNNCVCFVLHTGFQTTKGTLIKTILSTVDSSSVKNDWEVFLFMLFLSVYAIVAAAYVWIHGSQDPERNKYKLVLECMLILTSVIPPELPVQLSLAVSQSLMSLIKNGIFCTEPFRVPFAGSVDICFFDKTGTITSDKMEVEHLTMIDGSSNLLETNVLQRESLKVLAGCHSLVRLDDSIEGDPIEKAVAKALGVKISDSGINLGHLSIQPIKKFAFTSKLRRMSVVATVTDSKDLNSSEPQLMVLVKGAPETLRNFFIDLDQAKYDHVNYELVKKGFRVLALGYKLVKNSKTSKLSSLTREEAESKLHFAGFLSARCPLKSDSFEVIQNLMKTKYQVVMLTGDSALTACHVAQATGMMNNKPTLLLVNTEKHSWIWRLVEDTKVHFELTDYLCEEKAKELLQKYSLCVTGEGFDFLTSLEQWSLVERLYLPSIKIYSRLTPYQKEVVIKRTRNYGYTTLMCGDGSNDMGALRAAHIGIAVLSENSVAKQHKDTNELSPANKTTPQTKKSHYQPGHSKNKNIGNQQSSIARSKDTKPLQTDFMAQLMEKLKDQNMDQAESILKLGDASIAASFTSKSSSISCVEKILIQGRCALSTTMQIFRILAVSSLISAFSQSVLYCNGIRFSDAQMTVQGLLVTFVFYFIANSNVHDRLSHHRVQPNIFNFYMISTIMIQSTIHLATLIGFFHYLNLDMANSSVKWNDEFKPSIINSIVYIQSLFLQITSFLVNYQGEPFMVGLTSHKKLRNNFIMAYLFILGLILDWFPEVSNKLQIVPIVSSLRKPLICCLAGNVLLSTMFDRILRNTFQTPHKEFI